MAISTPGFPLKRGGPRFVNTLVTFEDEKPVDFTRILPLELILQSLLYLRQEVDVLSIRATCWTLRRIALLHELLLIPLSFNPGWPTKKAMAVYLNGDIETAAVCDWSSPLKYLGSTEFHHHITTLNFKVPGTDTVHMAPAMWDATLWPQLQSLEIRWDSDCELSCIPAMPKNLKRLKIIGPADYAWTLADYAAALCQGLESLALFISLSTTNGYYGLAYIAERCGATLASLHLAHGKLTSACEKIALDVLAPLGSRELFPALKNVSFDLQIWGVTGGPTLNEGNSNPGVISAANQRVAFLIRLYRAWNSHRGWRYSAASELVESAFKFEDEAQALHINEIQCFMRYDHDLETLLPGDVRGWLQWMVQETDWNRELCVGPPSDLSPTWQPWPLVFSSLSDPDDGLSNVIMEHLKVLKLVVPTNLLLQVGFRPNVDPDRHLRKHKQVMTNLHHLIIDPVRNFLRSGQSPLCANLQPTANSCTRATRSSKPTTSPATSTAMRKTSPPNSNAPLSTAPPSARLNSAALPTGRFRFTLPPASSPLSPLSPTSPTSPA